LLWESSARRNGSRDGQAPGHDSTGDYLGQVQMTPTKQGTDLKLEAAGIHAGPLLSYLPKGCKPALQDGKFLQMITDLTSHPDGGSVSCQHR
jgi:hypothetical protein